MLELIHAYPVTAGLTICSLMVIAFLAAITAWHPRHHGARHRPSRAHH